MKVADIEVSHHTDKSIIARIRMYRLYRGGSRDSLDGGAQLWSRNDEKSAIEM
jgi:hypothetical protein